MQTQTKKTNTSQDINGILLLDKPINCTSNFILQRVKHLFQAKKAGHTGCLDPLATGMLPICFGEATKFSDYLLNADKCYEVTAHLGVVTNTGDAEGEVIARQAVQELSAETLVKILDGFVGELQQMPPMFSALKHNGQPLYKYARLGLTVERNPRQVTIFSIELLKYNINTLQLRVVCSKGTYIRTLIEDIGLKLGCGAHVTQLRRIYTAGFANLQMFSFANLQLMQPLALISCLLPLDFALQHLPKICLEKNHIEDICNGKLIYSLDLSLYPAGSYRLYDAMQKNFIGIGKVIAGEYIQAQRLLSNDFLGINKRSKSCL